MSVSAFSREERPRNTCMGGGFDPITFPLSFSFNFRKQKSKKKKEVLPCLACC